MTQNRKAELQRKLSMAPVAKPPSDLADRIKAEIPDFLDTARDRARLSHSVAFSLRVAASIVLLITSVFLTIDLMSRDEMKPPLLLTPVERSDSPASPMAELSTGATTQSAEPLQPPTTSGARAAAVEADNIAVAEEPAARRRAAPPAESIIAEVSGGMNVPGERPARDSMATVAPAAAPPAAPLPPPPAMAEAKVEAVPAAAAAAHDSTSATIGFSAESEYGNRASSAAVSAPAPAAKQVRTVAAGHDVNFGLSINPAEFDRVKELLARGQTPRPAQVDVAALVNHFAGSSQNSGQAVRLQVEASRAPLARDETAIIRYTIDAPSNDPRFRLTRADLSIALEKGVIAEHRTVGGVRTVESAKGVLYPNQSATGLVELRLKSGTRSDQRVATIILKYHSPGNDREERVIQEIRAADLDSGWRQSSRRHKIATLGALWAESLTGAKRPADLDAAAAELAGEAPGDPLAQELAAVTASSRPRSSAPTGSGR